MNEGEHTPIVGCPPVADPLAGDYHRRWRIGDGQGGWLDPSNCPALANIALTLRLGYLVLRAPGMLRLDIPLDVIEDDESVCQTVSIDGREIVLVDEGDLAAAWLSRCLGCSCRLYKIHPDHLPGNADAAETGTGPK